MPVSQENKPSHSQHLSDPSQSAYFQEDPRSLLYQSSHGGVGGIEEEDVPYYRFKEDPFMASQVEMHDDIINKHNDRQQRIGSDGIDNDSRYNPVTDYVRKGVECDL